MAPYIPPKTSQRIKDLGLSDWIVLDTFNTGNPGPGPTQKYKKYDQWGYTVRITYVHNENGKDIITYVTKY